MSISFLVRNGSRKIGLELGDVLFTKVGTTGIAIVVDTEREFSIFYLAFLKLLK